MPIYTYQIIHDDGSEGETFEVVRAMSEAPLERHPETGERVRRVYQPVHIAGSGHERHVKAGLSDKNLEAKGFTKYVRSGKGHYERHAGTAGPETLHAD